MSGGEIISTPQLDCAYCRKCGSEMLPLGRRVQIVNGVRLISIEKYCSSNICNEQYTTMEIPAEVALDVFADDISLGMIDAR